MLFKRKTCLLALYRVSICGAVDWLVFLFADGVERNSGGALADVSVIRPENSDLYDCARTLPALINVDEDAGMALRSSIR